MAAVEGRTNGNRGDSACGGNGELFSAVCDAYDAWRHGVWEECDV